MEDSGRFARQEEARWSPPQTYTEPQDIRNARSSPQTLHAYSVSPPIPPKEQPWEPYQTPSSPVGYSAPEVVNNYMYPQYDTRPMSPSSQGGTTLPITPNVPPYSHEKIVDPNQHGGHIPPPEESKLCGMRRKVFYLVLAGILFCIIALGLGLGLGLTLGLDRHNSSSAKMDPFCRNNPTLCIGGMLDEKYYSKKGAFNGSGIALAGESWNKEQRRIFTIYFQHWTGDIRFMQYTTDRKWVGGGKAQTIASDAKNATPISTVAYNTNGTQTFHIFYVSKNNTLRQMTMTNVSSIWEPGILSDLNLPVWNNPTVGLQACWKGNFYGDSDYSKFPTTSGEQNNIPFEQRLGMNIWYPLDDSTFQQYAWYQNKTTWAQLDKWQGKNTHSGVGCYSWGAGTTTYTMMVSKSNAVEFWWKDTNTTLVSEDSHPINSWQNSTQSAIGNVYPSTSLGYTTYFYAQMQDRSMRGFNVTYAAENTTIVQEDGFVITDPAGPVLGLGGTHLTMTAYAEKDGNKTLWDSLYVFYQTAGDDITAFTRPIAGGEWSVGKIPIPNE
ncbi:hypothetical protein BCR34DRAFT_570945 [Clohesyomyces aquaticus]|uniref:Fucose-specific lectin n=1 Tax=Clohesyomyces aquaticus TaxID=1231657 RepID=A0A1Y1Z9V6_9PLEO|nr:hypothetical protein BCR34DRAFT_570945 [Clohesyomyces aquaticus]